MINLEKVTNFVPTDDQMKCYLEVLASESIVNVIKPKIKKLQKEILNKNQFICDIECLDENEKSYVVLDPKDTYLLSSKDAKKFYKEYAIGFDKLGLKVSDPKFCPLLVAEYEFRNKTREFVNEMSTLTGITHEMVFTSSHSSENWKKLTKITKSFMGNFI